MIRLRRQQIEVMDAASRERFLAKLTALLRSEHADLVGERPEADLRRLAQLAIERAQGYKLMVEADVYEFAVLLLALGAEWPQRPEHRWAHSILSNVSQSPDARLYQVRERLLAEAESGKGA